MSSVISILNELEETAGSLAKREILVKNKNNELLKNVFVAAGDPYTVYYVNKFKVPGGLAAGNLDDDAIIYDFLALLSGKLATRELTGNSAKQAVTSHFALMNADQQKWCQRILLKNLRCGVQESTVNKVWPGTLKSFSVALAATLKSEFVKGEGIKIIDRVKYPVRVEPKLDGLRCIAVKHNGEVTFYTRNGTVLETLPKIKAALAAAPHDNIVFDGEAMGADWNESASVVMSKKTKKDDSNIIYNVFDCMSYDQWVAQECNDSYSWRCGFIKGFVEQCLPQNSPVRQVPHIMAMNETQLKEFFAKCMNEGFEGVMLKTLDTGYEFDRSKNILKLKPCVTYEGVIVDHYDGRRGTKREGLFGGFEIVLPNGIVTRIGGGFNDLIRAEIQLEGPDAWIGKVVEIEAQPDPLTPDGLTVDGKARFPVFMRIRDRSDVDHKVIDAAVKWFEENT